MRRAGLLLALLSLAAATAAPAELNVSLRGELMDIRAQGASVFEILTQISRQTGMQVVPDGAPPATPVSLVLEGRTPAEIVLSVLESAGVGYAAQLDRAGQKVTRVMLVRPGAAAPSAGTQTRPNVRPVPAARPEPPVREESPEPEEAEQREPPVPPEAGRGQQAMEAAPPPASMQSLLLAEHLVDPAGAASRLPVDASAGTAAASRSAPAAPGSPAAAAASAVGEPHTGA
jgi:hypothetical protein